MNLILEACKKYDGKYFEDNTENEILKNTVPSVKTKKAIFNFKGEQYLIALSFFEGPYIISSSISEQSATPFKIYKISNWDKTVLNIKNRLFGLTYYLINQDYRIIGDSVFSSKMFNSNQLSQMLLNEEVFVEGYQNPQAMIVLKPFKGINDLQHLEKYLNILHLIKEEMKTI